jgi:choline dehydrogenase-like flavoprotein
MIIDFESSDYSSDEIFDVCIVGAGAAGLCLAHQLLESGKRIILLEGGGRDRWERRSQALNRAYFSGFPFDGAHAGRFRGIGGTTSAWAGQIMEFDDIDFEKREWVPGSSWPLTKADLSPFYRRAADLEGVGSLAQDDDAVWSEIGAHKPDLGEELEIGFSRFCPEPKFARVFNSELHHSKLILLTHANAVSLNFSDETATLVQNISFRSLNGREGVVAAKIFVLCLGGIESSRFLLNQSHSPWNITGLVGKNFQDHVRCHAARVFSSNAKADNWFFGPLPLAKKYTPKIKLSAAAQHRHKLLNACGMIELHDDGFRTMRTAVQVLLGPAVSVTARQLFAMTVDAPRVLLQRYRSRTTPALESALADPFLLVNCEQPPESTSSISLSSKKDTIGLYRAKIDWQISQWEISTIRAYVRFAMEFFKSTQLAQIVPDERLFTDKVTDLIVDHFHHCGGTKMAKSQNHGVVDPNLGLFGTANAYVCSASVFPSSGFGNPTHTLIALAIRLSDHLNSRLS